MNWEDKSQKTKEYVQIFGDKDIAGTPEDLLWLLKEVDRSKGRSPFSISAAAPGISSMRTIRLSVRPAPRPSCH